MQVTETVSEGLKRQLKVVIPAADLLSRVEMKLEDIKTKVRLNGFRPGKVPLAHVRQLYGRSVMAEVLEETVGQTSAQALQERHERPAFQPDIKLPEDKETVERMISGASDLEYTMSFEVLPKIDLTDLKSIALEKEVAEPEADDVKNAVERLLKANVSYEAKDGEAETGDRLSIDYKGSVDGEPFEGGAGEDAYIVIGSSRFIPGFEEGLLGAKAGDKRDVNVTFPEDYQAKHLAGKDAVFDVTVKEVAKPVDAKADDEFARTLGMESFAKLEEAIRGQLQRELDTVTRNKLKKSLLDALDERHSFEMPPSLLDSEFEGIWRNVTRQLEQSKSSFEAQGTSEEKARADYRKLSERRVRLGLVLSEIGNQNQIKVTDEELRRAVMERARQFPGQEREVVEFYRKNPNAINELRAPVYEEKVINFALELVKLDEKKVTPAQLTAFAAEQQREQALLEGGGEHEGHDHHGHEGECGPECDHDHDHGHHHHG
ncbi:MAG: trigger factor [Rhodomicrobium sp.]